MVMKRLAIAMLCVSLTAGAQKNPYDANVDNTTVLNPSCPITLTGLYAGHQHRTGTLVSIHFVNQTEKRLIAIKVGIIGFDATRDSHDFSEPYAIAVNLKPQREARPIWRVQEGEFETKTSSGARVYLTKLVFSDGTTWEDDGTKSCSLSIMGIAKPKRQNDD
jgi:hypothetical protein